MYQKEYADYIENTEIYLHITHTCILALVNLNKESLSWEDSICVSVSGWDSEWNMEQQLPVVDLFIHILDL